ncbi:MAG: nitrilase [Epsilonproteobacteria bacterium]|nr:MAG: nitrilase [Campylobacterota bacterium]
MRVTLVQNAPRLNRTNLSKVLELIRENSATHSVLVFPELALNGYLLQDKVFEDAWSIIELEALMIASAQCDIVIGAAIKENGRTFNSVLYFSKGELLHMHHKIHLPNYGMFEEARYFFKGDAINTFESDYGKSVMLVCEDLWRADVIADLASVKPDIIYIVAASPARDFSDKGLLIESQWDALLKSTAILCSAYVVFVNRVGFEDGLGFWGGSRVITPKGEIEIKLPNFAEAMQEVELSHTLHAVEKWMAKID